MIKMIIFNTIRKSCYFALIRMLCCRKCNDLMTVWLTKNNKFHERLTKNGQNSRFENCYTNVKVS